MFDRPVRSIMQRQNVLKAPPETSVTKAAKRMATKNVGAVMVVEDDALVGIFTERDIVFRVVARGLDAKTTCLGDVMTRQPHTVEPDQPFGYALHVMHEHGFRHLPVIENGKPIGIVSSRSAMDPELEDFVSEAQRRQYFRDKR
jgi:CBS domain-containing protein